MLNGQAGHLNEARTYLERVLAFYRSSGQPQREAADLAHLADIDQAERDEPTARAPYDEAFALADAVGDPWVRAQVAHNKGLLCQAHGQLDEALAFHDAALAVLAETEVPQMRWRILSGRATAHRLLGNWEASIADLRNAIELIESVRERVLDERHRIGFFGDDPTSAYLKMIAFMVERGELGETLTYVERARSRTFLDLIGRSPAAAPLGWTDIQRCLR